MSKLNEFWTKGLLWCFYLAIYGLLLVVTPYYIVYGDGVMDIAEQVFEDFKRDLLYK